MLGMVVGRKLEEPADPPPSKEKAPAAPAMDFIPPELAGMFGGGGMPGMDFGAAPAGAAGGAEENWVPPELAGMFAQKPAVRSAGFGMFADDDSAVPTEIASIFAQNDM